MNDQRSPAPSRIASSTSADGRDAVVDQPQRLAPERLEHAVGDEAVDLLAHDERRHAERAVQQLGARSIVSGAVRSPAHSSTSGSR